MPSPLETTVSPWRQTRATLRSPHLLPLLCSNFVHFSAWYGQGVILQWLVTSLTDSRTLLGLVSFVQGTAMILGSPLAGVAVDRLSGRRVIFAGRLALASVLLAVAGLIAADWIAIWQVMIAVAVAALVTSLMNPATQTLVMDIVEPERAQGGVALNAAGSVLGQTMGPMVAALALGALGFTGAYSLTAGLLIASALMLVAVPQHGGRARPVASTLWWHDLREVLSHVRHTRPLKYALLACSMSVFNGAIGAMRPIFARHVLEVGSAGYGTLAAAAGAGGLLAALLLAARPPLHRPGLVIGGSMLAYSLLIVLYAFAFNFAYCLAIEFALGWVGQYWMVATFAGVQMAVPETMRGRVMGLVFMLTTLALPGALAVGLLADAVGDRLALGTFGVVPALLLSALMLRGHDALRAL